jgi:histidyl-tRNA synthetase
MRGFDYYTDVVFEIYDTNPENSRSMFGGGRYDGLVGLFGVEPVPTVGFGMGDVTIKNFLELHGLLPNFNSQVNLCVILIGDVYEKSLDLLGQLREAGLNVALDASQRKIDAKLKSAVKAGYPYVMVIGESELESNDFRLKELASGQEHTLKLEEVVEEIKRPKV